MVTFLLLATVSGCLSPANLPSDPAERESPSRPLLNSERIRQQFGSYGIDVLEEGDSVRVSNLYSIEGSSKVTRTLAVVTYPPAMPADILSAHQEVKSGGSIGEVFVQQGWIVSKQNLYFGELPVGKDWSGLYALMGGIKPQKLAVHVYEFVVTKEGASIHYATIAEIHHPEFMGKVKLEEIYGPEYAVHRFQNDGVRSILRTVRAAVLQAVPVAQNAASPGINAAAGTGR